MAYSQKGLSSSELSPFFLGVVNLMNVQGIKWIPGRQGGQMVRVQFNLPIQFKIKQGVQ